MITSQRKNDYVTITVLKLPNLNFANIKIQPFFRLFAKFNARQIFPLYGRYTWMHEVLVEFRPLLHFFKAKQY